MRLPEFDLMTNLTPKSFYMLYYNFIQASAQPFDRRNITRGAVHFLSFSDVEQTQRIVVRFYCEFLKVNALL